jgi:hypothetical protein
MKPKSTGLLAILITAITAVLQREGYHAEPTAIAGAATGVVTVAHVIAHPPVRKKLRKVLPGRPRGNPSLGLWVWESPNADEVCKKARSHGYGWIALKIHDGADPFNLEHVTAYRQACEKYGLKFGVWGYCRSWANGYDAAALAVKYHAKFYIADVETEFENAPRDWPALFCRAFKSHAAEVDPWLSSFGRVDLHPDIDYHAFAEAGFGFMPQAYSCESVELQPAACLRHAEDYWHRDRIQPTLGAYAGARGRLTPKRLASEAEGLGLKGVNVWVAQTATPEDLAEIARVV